MADFAIIDGKIVLKENLVEVVRCKNCIYQAECAFAGWLDRNGNGFCSCGEREEYAKTD